MTVDGRAFADIPKEELLLVCDIAGEGVADRAHFFALRPKDMAFPMPKVAMVAQDESSVTVAAETPILAVMLDGNVAYEDNGFLLLPNEERRIAYRRVFDDEKPTVAVYALGQK